MPPNIFEKTPVNLKEEGFLITAVSYENGIQLHLEGHPYPHKGSPNQRAVDAIDTLKRTVRLARRFPQLLLTPYKTLTAFNELANKVLDKHYLKPEYLTPTARELTKLLTVFFEALHLPTVTAKNIATVVEYDAAYRLRLQVLLSSIPNTALAAQPIRQLQKLCARNKAEDTPEVHQKLKHLFTLLSLLLYLPTVRKAFRLAILSSDFSQFTLDDTDRYWLSLRTDYHYTQTVPEPLSHPPDSLL